MKSTDNPTLMLIQREISEVAQREKELQHLKNNLADANINNNNNSIHITNGNHVIENHPPLIRAHSTTVLNEQNGHRKFAPNPASKGMMQRFINSRGKLVPQSNINQKSSLKPQRWSIPDVVESAHIMYTGTGEPVKRVRKGYVPVEERMKQEFQDLHSREQELRSERKKSQPDFSSLYDFEASEPPTNLRAAKSMVQLYNPDDYADEADSAIPSLKPARSLADLCDATDEELQSPSTLILQFEKLIQKNLQART